MKRTTQTIHIALVVIMAATVIQAREADAMSRAASDFLASLEGSQRELCLFEFEDAERMNWQPVPFGEAGVRLDALTETQQDRLRALLRGALSEEGVATVDGVIVPRRARRQPRRTGSGLRGKNGPTSSGELREFSLRVT